MQRISTVLEAWLVAQGMSAGSAGTDERAGIDAGKLGNPAIGRREGGQTGPMGMGKRTPAEPAPVNRERQTQGETTLMVAIATMKGARVVRTAPLMLIMDGGKS